MRSKIYIISQVRSNAAQYIFDFVFDQYLGVEYSLVERAIDVPVGAACISYGQGDEGMIHIPNADGLEAETWHQELSFGNWQDLPTIFTGTGTIPFDLFSACFHLLARVEEYQGSPTDEHGRYLYSNSVLSRDEFKGRPIVDEWIQAFGQHIQSIFSDVHFRPRKFEWINSFDIDIAFKYTHRSVRRKIAATGKNVLMGDWKSVSERTSVLKGKANDPSDTYAFQEEIARTSLGQTIYFFLLGSGGKMDRNISADNPDFRKLIKHISTYAEVGIHPSYLSGDTHSELAVEIGRLTEIVNQPVTQSRQHFLRMQMPQTYRRLIAEGIESDYTMGYAEDIAFRAGTCTPYFFFDLEENKASELKIYPLTIMEGTLRDYLKLTPEDAIVKYKELIERVKSVEGTFISLWHNDSISQDSPWRAVYKFMVQELNDTLKGGDA